MGERFKLSTKMFFVAVTIVVCISSIFLYIYPKVRQRIIQDKYQKTREVVETAWCILDFYEKQVEAKKLSLVDAKQLACDEIKDLRYGKDEYFWIIDMLPRMVMHPIIPSLDGKDMRNVKDPTGKILNVEMVNVVKKKGAGFVEYEWPKPGSVKPVPKVAYVKGFPKWGWIVCSGIYLDDMYADVNRLLYLILGAVALVTLGCILLSYVMSISISRPVIGIIGELNQAADRVSQGSSQLSSAGQSLAEGVSEQAAGIEETSSTMEEMASMTKRNAENARRADTMMQETSQTVDEVNSAMLDLTRSMSEISQASEETAKIIKTIDEIAFQTNLLALNAAVEAARAGEAGAGFAVVADEVRNLAMRAADSAKNTADLLEGTVKKIKAGSEVVTRANGSFEKMAEGAKKIGELLGDIAKASEEQSLGISEINTNIAQMDKIVQKNAAIAEESASSAQEMHSEAAGMHQSVGKLACLVFGNTARAEKV
ncbi:MAG: methyl-accepting chemotaxis protein [Syntrophobacteraceae bacterium]